MGHISFDYSKALGFFNQEEIDHLQSTVTALDILEKEQHNRQDSQRLK